MLQGICSHEDVRRRRRRRRRCSRYKFEFKWLFIDSWNIEFGLASVEHDERAHTQRAKSTFLNRTEHGGSSTESLKRDTAPHRTIFARFVQSNYCGEWKRFLSSSFDFNQLPPQPDRRRPGELSVARAKSFDRGCGWTQMDFGLAWWFLFTHLLDTYIFWFFFLSTKAS